jgi:hypothetical protein
MGWFNSFFSLVIIEAAGPGSGLFVYSGAPGLGNLVSSVTGITGLGTDPFGNTIIGGNVSYGPNGAPDVINVVTGFGADPTFATASDAAFAAAVSYAATTKAPLVIPAGHYKFTSTVDWRKPGLVVNGAGPSLVTLEQTSNNLIFIEVAGQAQNIGGFAAKYTTLQGAASPNSAVMAFGDATVGSCFMSYFHDLEIEQGYNCLEINPNCNPSLIAGLFSCTFENIQVLGGYNRGIYFYGNAGGGAANCTGCAFINVYVHNNFSGSDTNWNDFPILFKAWDEIFFAQLNLEHSQVFNNNAVGFSLCGSVTINALHLEHLELSGTPGNGLIYCDNSMINISGVSVRFCTFTGGSYNSLVKFEATTGGTVFPRGVNFPASDGGVITPIFAYVDFSNAQSAYAQVDGIITSQATTNSINDGTNSCNSACGQVIQQGAAANQTVNSITLVSLTGFAPVPVIAGTYLVRGQLLCREGANADSQVFAFSFPNTGGTQSRMQYNFIDTAAASPNNANWFTNFANVLTSPVYPASEQFIFQFEGMITFNVPGSVILQAENSTAGHTMDVLSGSILEVIPVT